MINAKQIKAARMLLDWGQVDLAEACGLSKTAIANIEKETNRPSATNAEKIRDAFDRAGVEFIDGGVREKRDMLEVLTGYEGVKKFYDMVFTTAANEGGEFLVYGVDEAKFTDAAIKAGINESYRKKMASLKDSIFFKVLISEKDTNDYAADHCEYRRLSDDLIFGDAPFYIFANNLALIVWHEPPKIIIITDKDLTEAYRRQFHFLWEHAHAS